MSNDEIVQLGKKTFNLSQIGAWIAFCATLFMFWQFMRDVHKDTSDIKERTAQLEVTTKYLLMQMDKLEEK